MKEYKFIDRIKFALQFRFFPKKLKFFNNINIPQVPTGRDILIHNIWLDIKKSRKRRSNEFA